MKIDGFGKASEQMIADFEKHIGFKLPEDYKEFLRQYNGGAVYDSVFWVEELQEIIPLDVLFGLGIKKNLDLMFVEKELKDDLLQNCIAIGLDPGGGVIVLANSLEIQGVYYWDDAHYFERSSKEENVYKIADSFSEFINGLQPEPE